ncbi:MAG: hypothetical protein ABL940_01540 [Bacteroidia bacterium]
MKENYLFNQSGFKELILTMKDFGLSKKSTCINNKYYYELNGGIGFSGFIRMEGEKLYLMAVEDIDSEFESIDSLKNEQLCIDFSAEEGKSWKICCFSNSKHCLNVTFKFKAYSRLLNDTAYAYQISRIRNPNYLYDSEECETVAFISKKYGFIYFSRQHQNNEVHGIYLYPKPIVTLSRLSLS